MDRNGICSCETSDLKHFWKRRCSHHNDIRYFHREQDGRAVEVHGPVNYLLVGKW